MGKKYTRAVDDGDLRECRVCKRWLPRDSDHFARTYGRRPTYLSGRCHECESKRYQLRYARHRRSKVVLRPTGYRRRGRSAEELAAIKREQRERHKASKIKRRYGLTREEHAALVASGCAICGATTRIVVDHCHVTGRVRGPLCNACNRGLGMFKDDPDILRRAVGYLIG